MNGENLLTSIQTWKASSCCFIDLDGNNLSTCNFCDIDMGPNFEQKRGKTKKKLEVRFGHLQFGSVRSSNPKTRLDRVREKVVRTHAYFCDIDRTMIDIFPTHDLQGNFDGKVENIRLPEKSRVYQCSSVQRTDKNSSCIVNDSRS